MLCFDQTITSVNNVYMDAWCILLELYRNPIKTYGIQPSPHLLKEELEYTPIPKRNINLR